MPLAWALRRCPGSSGLGRPGTVGTASQLGATPAVGPRMINAGLNRPPALERQVQLVVVGPEGPLSDGLADRLREAGLGGVRPGGGWRQARVRAKQWPRNSCRRAWPFRRPPYWAPPQAVEQALEVSTSHGLPLVVKADGLGARKGVTVADRPGDDTGKGH